MLELHQLKLNLPKLRVLNLSLVKRTINLVNQKAKSAKANFAKDKFAAHATFTKAKCAKAKFDEATFAEV